MKVCMIVCLVLYILSWVVYYVISLWVCVSETICMKACKIVCLVLYILSWVLSYDISWWVCVSKSICMKVCMIVCLVLYILSWVLSYFIMGVCQWEHMYESLHDCVSCPVYIVLSLKLFHYGYASVRTSVWKLIWLCVLSCIYCLES
jgi:hypothetical protein